MATKTNLTKRGYKHYLQKNKRVWTTSSIGTRRRIRRSRRNQRRRWR